MYEKIIPKITPKSEPAAEKYKALLDCPFRTKVCAGNCESAVSSAGIPKTSTGMKSKKVWVTPIEIMKIIIVKIFM